MNSRASERHEMKLLKALYILILSVQLVCMLKQRFATMMHVFASVNYKDIIEKIKQIKSENKKKRPKEDQKRPIDFSRDRTQTDVAANESTCIGSDVFGPHAKHKKLPIVRINTVPTAEN